MDLTLIGQAVGIVAMAFNILSYQNKNQKAVIAFQLFGSALFALSFLMLGAMIGGILNFIGIIRALVFMNKEKLHADKPIWLWGFIAAYLVTYVLTFTVFGQEVTTLKLLIEALPVIGMTALTLGFRMTDAKAVRRMGLISSPSWLIYNIASGSIGAIACEVITLASILIGMLRHDRKK